VKGCVVALRRSGRGKSGYVRAQLRASSDHAVHQEVHDSVRRWHGMERGVSVPVTSHDTLSSYCAARV
jgi:hypothetical protein